MSSAPVPRARAKAALCLEQYLPYRLSVAANEVSRLIARAYQDRFGLSIPQWRILANLGEQGPLTPLQIGKLAAMEKVTVSRAAQGLIERGYLERRDNGADRRSHILVLTHEGAHLYETIAPVALAFERALLDQWSDEEIQALHDQLKLLQHKAATLAELG